MTALREAPDGPASHRQQWILEQLRDGVKLQRQAVQKQFGISEKQAKRELSGLSGQGLIVFVRKPRPGYYRVGGSAGQGGFHRATQTLARSKGHLREG